MFVNKLFEAKEYPLEIYNGQPIIDVGMEFFYDDCGVETDFDFPNYSSSYLKIFNERLGRTIRTIPLTRTDNFLVINSTDTVFDDNGKYFYMVAYLMTGGYERVLRYGTVNII